MKRRHAFTLVELLVVVAIIALLLSILLPSLEAAREQARTVVCGTRLKDIYSGASIYANQFNGWLPGSPGTSGAALTQANPQFGTPVTAYDWEQLLYVATAAWDWATPIAHYGLGWKDLPKDRRRRTERIREEVFRCASNNFLSVPWANNADQTNDWPVTTLQSYTTTRAFMYFPYGTAEDDIQMPSFFSVRTPTGHRPRLGQLEKPASKVFMGEGARYNDRAAPDHTYNIEYDAAYGGAFSTAGASSGYSRGYINPIHMSPTHDDPRFDRNTYRHLVRSERGMNGLFFDGHAIAMSKREAILSIDYWWPSQTALSINGDVVDELKPPPPYNPKPRANDVALERAQQDGTPWGLSSTQVIVIN